MTPTELKQKIDNNEDMLLLDIREPDEVAAGDGIPGSENMPMGEVFTEAAKGNLPKDRKIVAVCKSGGRCAVVAEELRPKGYDIDILEGGLIAWKGSSV